MQSENAITPAGLRLRAGLTQRQVAAALNKKVATVSDWERFVKYPQLTFSEVLTLMQLYKCTLEDLAIAFDRSDPD
jgi:DNA-binding transcriptional regulator YiaG